MSEDYPVKFSSYKENGPVEEEERLKSFMRSTKESGPVLEQLGGCHLDSETMTYLTIELA